MSNPWLHIPEALPYLGAVLVMGFCMFGHGGHGGSSTHQGHGEQEAPGGPARPGPEGGGALSTDYVYDL
ncbi:hypothetical protein [Arthrobacter sp. SO5]|uniref:hypothetical protein n=1 Tax=Arthrobacter sp. SO5 TaxID=1897055 RepID=UPI0035AC28D8